MAHRKRTETDEEPSYWLSYSDMMAGLLLMFVIIMSVYLMQAQKQFEENEAQARIYEMKKLEYERRSEELEKKNGELQEQLDRIIGVRTNLIEALRDEFEGTNSRVIIDAQTGAIMFDSSILFDFNKAVLKPSGMEFLDQFLPQYLNVIMEDTFRPYISEIIIEGHTDSVGGYLSNLDLSQKRALAVATYCLQDNGKVLPVETVNELKPIITANGRSYSNTIKKSDGTEDSAASRRVEFKFRLKEDEMIEEMKSLMSE